jgi:hypothetical protein
MEIYVERQEGERAAAVSSVGQITSRYWRIRLRVNRQHDFSDEAWKRDEVGIWYGAWTADDLQNARNDSESRTLEYLNSLPAQRALGWEVQPSHLKTALRFDGIAGADWILMYLQRQGALGLAQIDGKMESKSDHPFNNWNDEGEIFKYRRIHAKKIFKLSDLPDAYRLLSAQGRSNVHEFHGMRDHVELLAKYPTADALRNSIREMPFERLLDFFGASSWESFCFAYLIMEEKLVPTGLSIGRTLKDVDIVGRAQTDGRRIIAQCKKNPDAQPIEDSFFSAISSRDVVYYFAYGGVSGEVPSNVKIIKRSDALNWATSTKNGQLYRRLLLGESI